MDTKQIFNRGNTGGLLLIGLGLLLLLSTMGVVRNFGSLTFSLGFLGAAAVCFLVYLADRSRWGLLFPAFGLGFIGIMIGTDTFLPFFHLGGMLFLGGLGACFAAIYATGRQHLWAILPAGILLTLGAVAGLDQILPWWNHGTTLFVGWAATFAFYWYESDRQRTSWALIVAAVCAGIAALTLIGTMMKIIFPLALVGIGIYLITRTQRNNP